MRGKLFSIVTAVCLTVSIVGNFTVASAEEDTKQEYVYNVGASATSGQNYRWTVPMTELVNKYSDFVTLNPITTTGSVENMNLILSGDAPLGCVSSAVVQDALNGTGDFEATGAISKDQIKLAYAITPDYLTIYVPKDSDAETWADLEGKTVACGETGTGTRANTIVACTAMGTDYETYFDDADLSYADAAAAWPEGWLDAVMCLGNAKTSTAMEMDASPRGVKMISLTPEEIETACANNSIFVPRTLDDPFTGEQIETFGSAMVLACSSEVPDEVTYEIARIINEHVDELAEAFEYGDWSVIENTVDSCNLIDYAGGTEEYMKEMGVLD